MKQRILKSTVALLLVAVMGLGAVLVIWPGLLPKAQAAEKFGDDGTTNWDFIIPVTHQKTAPNGYIGIYTAQDLYNIRNDLAGNYILMNDIDLADWGNWIPIGDPYSDDNIFKLITISSIEEYYAAFEKFGTLYIKTIDGNFEPIHYSPDSYSPDNSYYYAGWCFFGTFDGNGHIIKNMTVNLTREGVPYAGLFGRNKGNIRNIGIVYSSISIGPEFAWHSFVGGIVGDCLSGDISNCYNGVGIISVRKNSYEGHSYVGGIAGTVGIGNDVIDIKNCYNTCDIFYSNTNSDNYSVSRVGGIAGTIAGTISDCYNTGYIYSSNSDYNRISYVGGITGECNYYNGFDGGGSISDCYNTGSIISSGDAGGIIGVSTHNSISNCYNTGSVSANFNAGGIAGINSSSINYAKVSNCYNAGTISSSFNAGGIVGDNTCYYAHSNYGYSMISHCYNTGSIILPSSNAGGIAGNDYNGIINSSYFLNNIGSGVGNGSTSGTYTCTAAEMRQKSTFVDFDFISIWDIDPNINNGYPFLKGSNPIGGGDPGEPDPLGIVEVDFYLKTVNKDIKLNVYWSDNFFCQNAIAPNGELQIASLVLCETAYREDMNDLVKTLKAFGFTDIAPYEYFDRVERDRVAHTIARKEAVIDGKPCDIVAVVCRGTGCDLDTDSNVWAGKDGFEEAYKNVASNLKQYLITYDLPKNSIKFLVTGHSRGGAVANLLGANITHNKILGALGNQNNVYTYCFASPPSTAEKPLVSDNIRTLVNWDDYVPINLLGGDTHGKIDVFQPKSESEMRSIFKELTDANYSYTSKLRETGSPIEVMFGHPHQPETYLAYLLMNSPISLNERWDGVRHITIKCPVDIEVYESSGLLVGRIAGNEIDENVEASISMWLEGDAKHFILPRNEEYVFKMTGTDNGKMDYTISYFDPYAPGNIILEQKEFQNVTLFAGKTMTKQGRQCKGGYAPARKD